MISLEEGELSARTQMILGFCSSVAALGWSLRNALLLRGLPRPFTDESDVPAEKSLARCTAELWRRLAVTLALLVVVLGAIVLFFIDLAGRNPAHPSYQASLSFMAGAAVTLFCAHLAVVTGHHSAFSTLAARRAGRALAFACEGFHVLVICGLVACFRIVSTSAEMQLSRSAIAYALGCAVVATCFRLSVDVLYSAARGVHGPAPLAIAAKQLSAFAGPLLAHSGALPATLIVAPAGFATSLTLWAAGLLCVCAVDLATVRKAGRPAPWAAALMLGCAGLAWAAGTPSPPALAVGLALSLLLDLLWKELLNALPELSLLLLGAAGCVVARWGAAALSPFALGLLAPSPLRLCARLEAVFSAAPPGDRLHSLLTALVPLLCLLTALAAQSRATVAAATTATVVGALLPHFLTAVLASEAARGRNQLRGKTARREFVALGAGVAFRQAVLSASTLATAAAALQFCPAAPLLTGFGLSALLTIATPRPEPIGGCVLAARCLALAALLRPVQI